MNEQLKKRLVGAIVLVALGIIFIPMLLDGGKRSGIPTFGSNVPPQPDYDFKTLDIPLEPPKAHPRPDRPQVIDKPQSPPAVAEKPQAAAEPAPSDVAKAPPPEATPKPKPKPATASEAEKPVQAWAVQVGSFADSANALALRDKLRQGDFPCFVESVKVNGTTTYRVRVGPTLERAEAEALMQRLAAQQQIKGLVLRHP